MRRRLEPQAEAYATGTWHSYRLALSKSIHKSVCEPNQSSLRDSENLLAFTSQDGSANNTEPSWATLNRP